MTNHEMVKVLDHGYVQLVETWGSDERIVESARMSTGKGFNGWGPLHAKDCKQSTPGTSKAVHFDACCDGVPGDEKLLRFLYENKHMSPFEQAGMTIEAMLPIFVIREWHRHRTQAYNEMSARYTPLPDVNYIPTVERLMLNATTANKQAASTGAVLTTELAERFRKRLVEIYAVDQELYEQALQAGVPKELARVHLPVGRYSRMRASANLRNWLQFLTLRMDAAAQWEIRQYANVVGQLVEAIFPRTWELFTGKVSLGGLK